MGFGSGVEFETIILRLKIVNFGLGSGSSNQPILKTIKIHRVGYRWKKLVYRTLRQNSLLLLLYIGKQYDKSLRPINMILKMKFQKYLL